MQEFGTQVPPHLVPTRHAPVSCGDRRAAGCSARVHGDARTVRPATVNADRCEWPICDTHANPVQMLVCQNLWGKPRVLTRLHWRRNAGRVQTILLARGIGVVCQGLMAFDPQLWPITWVMIPVLLCRIGALQLQCSLHTLCSVLLPYTRRTMASASNRFLRSHDESSTPSRISPADHKLITRRIV